MTGDVISDHFLMIWFQKDSLDTVSFRTFLGWPKDYSITWGSLATPKTHCAVLSGAEAGEEESIQNKSFFPAFGPVCPYHPPDYLQTAPIDIYLYIVEHISYLK